MFKVEPRWPIYWTSPFSNTSHIIKQKHVISSLSGDFSGSECNTGANNRKLRSDWVLPIEGKRVIIHVQNPDAAKKEKMRGGENGLSKKETACDEQRRGPRGFYKTNISAHATLKLQLDHNRPDGRLRK